MRIIIIIFLSASISFAQTAGKSGLSFLKIGFGARNIALADNGTSLANDVTALFYNPARLSGDNLSQIFFMHNEWIQDVKSELFGMKFTLFDVPFGIGINSTKISDIEVRTKPGDPIASFNAQYFFSSISTGFNLTNGINFGITAKYIYEDMFTEDSQGWGIDIGSTYLFDENLNFSLAIRNIGVMNKLKSESSKLPSELRLGPSYSFSINEYKLDINLGLELQKYFSSDDMHINSAAELCYDKLLAIRVGYLTFYESKSVTAGLGIMWKNLNLDYAITPFTLQLGIGHSISLSYKF